MAGYEQQDAHEFFIATLDLLHTHCKNAKAGGKVENYGSQQHSGTCNCIIDEVTIDLCSTLLTIKLSIYIQDFHWWTSEWCCLSKM